MVGQTTVLGMINKHCFENLFAHAPVYSPFPSQGASAAGFSMHVNGPPFDEGRKLQADACAN